MFDGEICSQQPAGTQAVGKLWNETAACRSQRLFRAELRIYPRDIDAPEEAQIFSFPRDLKYR